MSLGKKMESVMGNKLFVFCTILVLLASCTHANRDVIEESEVVTVQLKETGMSNELLPDLMAFQDSSLVVINRESSPVFYIHDRESFAFKGNFGTAGQGPKDFLFPFFLSEGESGNIHTYDLATGRISEIDLEKVMKGEEDWCSSSALPAKVMGCSNLARLGDCYYGNIDNGPGLFFKYNARDDSMKWIPFPASLQKIEGDYTIGNMNRIAVNGKNKMIASAMCYYNKIFIYDTEGNLIQEKNIGNEVIQPIIEEDGLSEESLYFCSDIKCTDKYIYLMLQQVTDGDSFLAHKGKESRILVLDWQLTPQATYSLDVFGKKFFIDEQLHRILVLALNEDGNVEIKQFQDNVAN